MTNQVLNHQGHTVLLDYAPEELFNYLEDEEADFTTENFTFKNLDYYFLQSIQGTMKNCVFHHCVFSDCDLADLIFDDCTFHNCMFINCGSIILDGMALQTLVIDAGNMRYYHD